MSVSFNEDGVFSSFKSVESLAMIALSLSSVEEQSDKELNIGC